MRNCVENIQETEWTVYYHKDNGGMFYCIPDTYGVTIRYIVLWRPNLKQKYTKKNMDFTHCDTRVVAVASYTVVTDDAHIVR